MDEKKPRFDLLIAAKKKDSGAPSDAQNADDLGMSEDKGMDGEGAEDSAIKDMLSSAKMDDVQGFKAALKDFIEICYPDMAEGSPEEEASEPPSEASAEGDNSGGM